MAIIGLGTVQFGLNYGISNKAGQTSQAECEKLLQEAAINGVSILDTAASYGNSETLLGKLLPPEHPFRIITKVPAINKTRIQQQDIDQIITSFQNSLQRLQQPKVAGLLTHRTDDLLAEGGQEIFACLQEFKRRGLVEKIGVSINRPEQIKQVLDRYEIDLIQIPINVLDQRLILGGELKELKNRKIEIHARSIFLQGLLLIPENEINAFFNPILPDLARYHTYLKANKLTPVQGALCFTDQITEIDAIILGVNNLDQLDSNLQDFNAIKNRKLEFQEFAIHDETMINPSLWNKL